MPKPSAVFNVDVDVKKERGKPRLVSLLFFDYSNVTKTDKLNLLGVYDQIYVDHITKKTTPIGVFVRVCKAWEFPITVTIFDPDNKAIGGVAFSVSAEQRMEGKDQLQSVGNLQFQATTEGNYWFDISYGGKSLGGAPLLLKFRDLKELVDGHTRGDA